MLNFFLASVIFKDITSNFGFGIVPKILKDITSNFGFGKCVSRFLKSFHIIVLFCQCAQDLEEILKIFLFDQCTHDLEDISANFCLAGVPRI